MGFFKKHAKAILGGLGVLGLVVVVDGEGDRGDGVLGGAGAITNDDGIAETLDTHLVDPEVAKVRGGLGVVELSLP